MEAIAIGLAVDAAKAITKVVAGSAFEEMKLVWGFKDLLENLKIKFKYIEALMNDLKRGKHAQNSELVNLWLEHVKDVACSAENLLDDYQYEVLRRKIELKTNRPSFKKKWRNYMKPSTNPIVFRVRMTRRVNQILSELIELEKTANSIGLQPGQLVTDAASPPLRSAGLHMDSLSQARKHAAAIGSDFIGREHDKEELLQRILDPSTNDDALSIIAIVGIGGLGKTTLARQLYEHGKIVEQFARTKVWICVSEDFHVDKILKEMAESLEAEKRHLSNIDAIVEELKKVLEGKKFFLVLDDVWNEDKELWNSLTARLRNIGGLLGSVVLVTTRSHKVASKACASHSHDLQGLSEDEGWELLKQQCFEDTIMPHDSSFDDVGKRIVVEKCKGVPLAIKSIGGLLQSKQHKSDWEAIERSEQWHFKADDNNYIMPSLLLSYNHIARVYLKQCFANCAIFPKDSVMKKGQIIALWLSEGLLHEESETSSLLVTQEVIGEDYINELVKYSFLQEEIDVHGRIRYKMHDLVHDLASYVLRKDLLVLKAGEMVEHGNYSQRRHLVLKYGKDELVPDYLTGEKMTRLRTISLWHEMPSWNSLFCGRYVRTLVLTKAGLTEVPSVILQLVHLRYLDLSKNHKIKELPELICKLYQLQTLRLWKCFGIKELPRELHKLENIRHIETSERVFASSGLRNLTSLQTLPAGLKLRKDEGWTIDELGALDQVKGDLCINGLEYVKNNDQARKADIGRKDKISRLELCWDESDEGNNDEDVLDGLEPHPYIRSILVEGFKGVSFPGWIKQATQLSHLTVLRLRNCKVCQKLPSLGQLPNLTILDLEKFDEVKSIGDEFYGNSNNYIGDKKVLFGALKELLIVQFKSLTSWMPPRVLAKGTSVFPKLELLEVRECRVLETVPALQLESLKEAQIYEVGGNQILDIIKGSPSLNLLQIEGVYEMVSLPKELSNFISLQTLEIMSFKKVEWVPGGMISLKQLWIWDCPSLGSIEEGALHGLSCLRYLDISRCVGLKRVPKSLEDCGSLEELTIRDCPLIECPEEKAVPDIGKLQGLKSLTLENAGGLMAYSPQWIPQLHRLQNLGIGGHRRGVEWDMSLTCTLPSLTRLYLRNFPNMKHLPLLPPSLQELEIEGFEDMEALPEWIGDLSSLQRLRLWDCNKLKYLPSQQAMSRLTRLTELHIEDCPQLSQRCDQHYNGPDTQCPKISRIPKREIKLNECSRLNDTTFSF